MNHLGFYKLSPEVRLPTYGNMAGSLFDIFSFSEDTYLYQGGTHLFHTGLIPVIPEGFSLKIYARSILTFEQNVVVLNTNLKFDERFADEMKILLYRVDDCFDYSEEPVLIKKFDRIAQGELVRNENVYIYEQYERPRTR